MDNKETFASYLEECAAEIRSTIPDRHFLDDLSESLRTLLSSFVKIEKINLSKQQREIENDTRE